MQNYSNYRVIYVDDCSADKNYAVAVNYIAQSGHADRVTMVHNSSRLGSLANIYTAVHTCTNAEIVIDLDGDDYLAHEQVFQQINAAYQSTGAWVVYSQHKRTNGKSGLCEKFPSWVIEQNAFRKYKWVSSHLRTFYAKLFKQIRKDDLLYQGDFFAATGDQAFMFPLLEMAGNHIYFLDEVLYLYNVVNPLNDVKINLKKAQQAEAVIRKMTPYKPLTDDVFWGL